MSLFSLTGPRSAQPAPSALDAANGARGESPVLIEVRAEFVPSTRGVVQELPIDVAADDLIEIEFADGLRTWLRADEYYEKVSAVTARGAQPQVLRVPASLPLSATGATSRGVSSLILKSLKVLGVNVEGQAALWLADRVEFRAGLRRPNGFSPEKPFGLFSCMTDTGALELTQASLPEAATDRRPYLVLLHGTLSSTWGSFGELWSPERTKELAALAAAYPGRVLAFEHLTLTVSPLRNALDLLEALPRGAVIHFVSHSRGGLVGELLSRAAPGFTDAEVAALPESQRPLLAQLQELVKARQIEVERFVRVACPVLGTTLVSRRLDRWLTIIGMVASKALPASPIADVASAIGDFVAAVIKQRTDPATLPGLEAMMPESKFVRLMNWPGARGAGELFVLAGDAAADSIWRRVLEWMTDRFYAGDHDLVVNTASMYGGARRERPSRHSHFTGPVVNHFNYFRNLDSAERLVVALTRDDAPGFESFEPKVSAIAREAGAGQRAAGARPILFLLPGTMGSELAVKAGSQWDRVWLDRAKLMQGTLSLLELNPPGGAAAALEPTGSLGNYCGALAQYLSATHDVIEFAWDWRLDPRIEGKRLAGAVEQRLAKAEEQKIPIRFLAHSAGGLIVRAMIVERADVWSRIEAIPGARCLLLGTPFEGTHWAIELLLEQAKTVRQLKLLDGFSEPGPILRRMPGLLALLPQVEGGPSYFDASTWSAFGEVADRNWAPPAADDLKIAAEIRAQLRERAPLKSKALIYVAGCAPATLCAVNVTRASGAAAASISLLATGHGDGRVTWKGAIPEGVSTWYVDAAHGDLASHAPSFVALAELLQTGTTRRLDRTPLADPYAAKEFAMTADAETLFPDDAALEAEALGRGPLRAGKVTARARPVTVSAVHGNLHFARFPVAVGHYQGDSILSAERALDRALDGRLSQRLQLGLYPGPLGTSAIVMNRGLGDNEYVTPKGALIVGLGTAGTLRGSQLTQSLSRALLEYVTEWGDRAIQKGEPLGVSALLIGTGMGGISVADSVSACVKAVIQANEELHAKGIPTQIEQLELVELWRDRALQVMDSFLRIEKEEPALRGHWTFNPQLQTLVGGRQRASFDELPGWWHRMQITGVDVPGSPRKELRFASLTQRARNEVRLQATDRDIVDKFVSRAIGSINYDERISSTLFELLLPNEFKDGSVIEGNLVLLLDDESAAYPWELLQDPLDQQPGAVRRPLICRRGILRQLETKVFRENVRASDARAVLVVGDPRSNFAPLAGAQEEARIAAQALEPRFAVTHLHRPEGDQVLMELRTGSYRVVHFAGHGVYEYPDSSGQKRTGMVIGNEMYLSPMLVEGIRRVPDLVFVNCCHLGFSAGKSTSEGDPSRLAANVAQQFIRIGARAVIAAGWAVEDQSAAEFARLFYELMLSGRTFGEATVAARKQIYDRFPQFNTWGAYQCYGDPDFRLVTEDTATSAARAEEFNFAAPALAVMQIEDIASQLQLLGDRDVEPHLKRLAALEKWLDADERKWLDKPGIQRALALAYWEALRYEEALRCFDRAVMKDAASLTLSDLEQLANLTTRAAVDVFLAGEAGTTRQKALDMLSSAQRYLDWLDLSRVRVAAAGADGAEQKLSPERLALFGSVYKRMTWVADPGVVPAMTAAVRKMKTHYQQALNGAAPDAYYHLLNVVASKLVELWVSTPNGAKPRSAGLKALQEELKKAEGYIKQALETRRDDRFALASRVDVKLYQQLCAGDLGGSALDALAKDYAGVRGLMSRRMFGSTRDQIAWLAVMAGHGKRDGLQADLQLLAERICGGPSQEYART